MCRETTQQGVVLVTQHIPISSFSHRPESREAAGSSAQDNISRCPRCSPGMKLSRGE